MTAVLSPSPVHDPQPLGLAGGLAAQGPVIQWVAGHRRLSEVAAEIIDGSIHPDR